MTLQEAINKRDELLKKANNYIKLQSEGHEKYVYGLTDSPYDSELRSLNSIISELGDVEFFKKWTSEYTESQRTIWNDACKSGKYKTPAEIVKVTKITYGDMKRAIDFYKGLKNA